MNTDGNLAALREYEKRQDAIDRRDMAIEEVIEEIYSSDKWLAEIARDMDPADTLESALVVAAELTLEKRASEADEAAAEAEYEAWAHGDRYGY